MVDIVVNNVAATTSSFTPDYSPYLFNNAEYYHPYAPVSWGNTTSEQVGCVLLFFSFLCPVAFIFIFFCAGLMFAPRFIVYPDTQLL